MASQALFTSKVCLAEINVAMKAHVTVIPILFEPVAHVTEKWTMINKNSPFEEKSWLQNAGEPHPHRSVASSHDTTAAETPTRPRNRDVVDGVVIVMTMVIVIVGGHDSA